MFVALTFSGWNFKERLFKSKDVSGRYKKEDVLLECNPLDFTYVGF